MLTNYLDKPAMIDMVKTIGRLPTSLPNAQIELMLVDTSATHINYPSQPIYRPYLVAALLLSQDTSMKIKKADGVEFKDWNSVILSLLYTQQSIDIQYGLELLPGTSIRDYLAILGLSQESGGSTQKRVKRFGSTVLPISTIW